MFDFLCKIHVRISLFTSRTVVYIQAVPAKLIVLCGDFTKYIDMLDLHTFKHALRLKGVFTHGSSLRTRPCENS